MFRTFGFRLPDQVIFGNDTVEQVGERARALGGSKALVVTDPGVIKAGLLERVTGSLEKAGLRFDVFGEVEPEPPTHSLEKAVAQARANKYDVFIGLGGGSSMDMTKMVSAMMTNQDDITEYFGVEKVQKRGLPTILIPTTSGTGSEVTRMAVFTDTRVNLKKVVSSWAITANMAIVDPMLTVSIPPRVTASTGIDAFIHAGEAYIAVNANEMTDPVALEAVRIIAENLGPAVADGRNIEARYNMSLGSLMAGIALMNAGAGVVHALAYPIGSEYHVPHGVANGVTLVACLDYLSVAHVPKFAKIAGAMGIPTEGLSQREAANKGIEAVGDLMRRVGLPTKLKDIGADPALIPSMAEAAFGEKRLLGNTPRQLSVQDLANILEASF